MDNMTVGERIMLIRKRQGMTQRELAQRCDMGQGDLWRIETGKTKDTRFGRMIKLAESLGVSLDELAGRTS